MQTKVLQTYWCQEGGGLVVKNPPANAGDVREAGLIPGSGRPPGGACCVMEGVVMIHPLVDRHDCCSLRKETRQAFAQAVPPTWDIFFSHHSFVKVKYHPLCGTILRQIWFFLCWALCLASMHYFPSLHPSPAKPQGKYLSTCLFSSYEK